LFTALDRAIEHNESAEAQRRGRWAVVVEPGGIGRVWPNARSARRWFTKSPAIWWPDGWEPNFAAGRAPNCVWKSQEQVGGQWLAYPQAEATMLALNRQCMDRPGATWHVVVAIENEAVSRTVSHDPSGAETTVEVRRMHVIRPEQGGHGECLHCPAHAFQCAKGRLVEPNADDVGPSQRAFGSDGNVVGTRRVPSVGSESLAQENRKTTAHDVCLLLWTLIAMGQDTNPSTDPSALACIPTRRRRAARRACRGRAPPAR